VTGENPSNHVFVDLDVERQGYLLRDSRTAPIGITLPHFDNHMDEFCARTSRAGLPAAIWAEQHPVLSLASWLYEGLAVSKASERLRNGAGKQEPVKSQGER
jgi:hypothetical protein